MMDYVRKQRSAAFRLLVIGAGVTAAVSCGDDQSPVVGDGTMLIGTRTTGSDFDANGYLVSVNSGQGRAIGNVDTVFVTPLDPGSYVVSLAGMAGNCSVPEGDNPQDATVVPGDTAVVFFNITCGPPGGGGGGLIRMRR